MPSRARALVVLPLASLAALALSSCGALVDAPSSSSSVAASDGASGGADASVAINATDTACEVAKTDLPGGVTTFSITNGGSQVTEVYVYDGDRIVTEKENIGPGTSYDLTVDLTEGKYEVACKPGMVGDGIRQAIAVTGGSTELTAAEQTAVDAYRAYVQQQADATVPLVQQLRDAIAAGDRAKAQSLYAPSRVGWESVEPVAESFGDLDPRMDIREADLEPGQQFTGWHRLEKALWQNEDLAAVVPVADQLLLDVKELAQRVPNAAITPNSIGNGAKELLDEVATGKITGEEEAFSHTDLVDFKGNVDGAQKAFEVLTPIVQTADPKLVTELTTQFAAVQAALAPYADATGPAASGGYVSYDTVTEEQRRELARVVDALSEPLSQLGAAAAGQA
ncbi:iron uptake system component EfeO [Quadrisphaera granulorum]|uniref:Iron uptake system component EfeO n=1 Tax=Quadrisphaera granulorum TaxID=317664 RepID=A0A316A6H0_9ACTN|nr:iron uptake system protein EfeO [Quadrisphaera granulorum]PWJ53471.1 iron uptake system component EfeO [Quadrisphaera granulorum]SZE96813.1 iron uptake system component EfeO [Quadrisphaera granulorum]